MGVKFSGFWGYDANPHAEITIYTNNDYTYELRVIQIEELKVTRLVMYLIYEDIEATAHMDLPWSVLDRLVWASVDAGPANEFRVALRRLEEERSRFLLEVGP